MMAARHPTAINQQLQQILSLLKLHATVGIYGMGGIGKTTLAKAAYNELQPHFSHSSAFVEVGPTPSAAQLIELQQQVLEGLCQHRCPLRHTDAVRSYLLKQYERAAFLLVIDDIWEMEHLEALLPEAFAPPFSCRILITSRNKECVERFANLPVEGLDDLAGMELLSQHAVGSRQPPDELQQLAAETVAVSEGLPLTLKVMGSVLRVKCYKSLEQERHMSRFHQHQAAAGIWQGLLKRLREAKPLAGGRDCDLWSKLQISYDYLADDIKPTFLDIAHLDQPQESLFDSYSILTLRQLSLLDEEDCGDAVLTMHQQLRDMGRGIANKAKSHMVGCQVCQLFSQLLAWTQKEQIALSTNIEVLTERGNLN